jgi:hypothetical protein
MSIAPSASDAADIPIARGIVMLLRMGFICFLSMGWESWIWRRSPAP